MQPGVHARKGKAMYLAWDMSNKGAPDYARSMSETRSRSRWSYEGEVEQWSEEEAE